MKSKKYSYLLVLILMILIGINGVYAAEPADCNIIFGSPSDPDSLRYLINEVLQYPKIIVPILVIVLGMLDLAKAVIASKEDEMRKAQTTFIKRILISVVIFFVPTIIDLLMLVVDLVLDTNGTCTL